MRNGTTVVVTNKPLSNDDFDDHLRAFDEFLWKLGLAWTKKFELLLRRQACQKTEDSDSCFSPFSSDEQYKISSDTCVNQKHQF